MEIVEYKSKNRKIYTSIIGCTLGLVGSVLSFIFCFILGVIVFAFDNLLLALFFQLFEEIFDDIFLFNIITNEANFFNSVVSIGQIYFFVVLIGFILGVIGTFMSWKNSTILSSLIMIVGGVFSLFCLLIPGILLIVGSLLNIICAMKNSRMRMES